MNPVLVFTQTLTLIICFFGLLGSVLCGIVLIQKNMKSSYTYLLLCLSLSDFILLVLSSIRTVNNFSTIIPQDISWVETLIFIWDWMCTGGTKYFTVAISLERYFAICHPLIHLYISSDRHAKEFSLAVAFFVFFLSIFSYIYKNYIDSQSFDIYAAIVLHFTPFLAVLILNSILYCGLREFKKTRKTLSESDLKQISITKMLVTVVLVFGVCYSFEFVRRILKFSGYFWDKTKNYYDYPINHLADIFYVTNSSVNFIIYCLLGRDFRNQCITLMSENPCISKAMHVWSPKSSSGMVDEPSAATSVTQ